MSLVVTDETRRRKLRHWWFRATMSDDPPSVEPAPPGLQSPPIPVELYGNRDTPTDATIGCFDFVVPENVGIAQVNVYRSTVSGGPYVLAGSYNPATDGQIFDTGLTPGQDYFYILKSVGDGIVYLAQESGASLEIPGPVGTVAVFDGGTGYTVNDVLTIDGGNGLATVEVTSVSGGIITGITLVSPGDLYWPQNNYVATGGTGADAFITVVTVAP